MQKFLLFVFSAVFVFPFLVLPVHAQMSETHLVSQYTQLIGQYRRQEDQTNIALSQYYRLKTLSSQEEAARLMRMTLQTRAELLITYFEILRLRVQSHPHITEDRQKIAVDRLTTLLADLKSHRSRLEIAVDRVSLDKEAEYIEDLEDRLLTISDHTQSILRIANLLRALEELRAAQAAIEEHIKTAPISETAKIEKQRGVAELSHTINLIQTNITGALTEYDEAVERDSGQILSNMQRQLGSAYTSLSQGVEYARELLR